MNLRILIMAGGTGGHVYPALAVAQQLRDLGAEVVWFGTRTGLEAKVVAQAGFDMEWVSVSGMRGKGWTTWLLAPFKLMLASMQSLVTIMRRRPMVVLGMGGFVAGPGGLVTWLLRKPLVIHEQNAIAGATNRILAPMADTVLEAFPATFPRRHQAITVGNPVRAAIAALAPPDQRLAAHSGALRLLVLGGSLGAQALNQVVPQAMAQIAAAQRPLIWHQCGVRHLDSTKGHYQDAGIEGRVEAFIEDMAQAYDWADLVLCRAGATTVWELAAAGVASILVPYPFAVDDHQRANAGYLVDAQAALLLPQERLSPQFLAQLLLEEFYLPGSDNAPGRARLQAMAQRARQLAMPQSAEQVAQCCVAAARAEGEMPSTQRSAKRGQQS